MIRIHCPLEVAEMTCFTIGLRFVVGSAHMTLGTLQSAMPLRESEKVVRHRSAFPASYVVACLAICRESSFGMIRTPGSFIICEMTRFAIARRALEQAVCVTLDAVQTAMALLQREERMFRSGTFPAGDRVAHCTIEWVSENSMIRIERLLILA